MFNNKTTKTEKKRNVYRTTTNNKTKKKDDGKLKELCLTSNCSSSNSPTFLSDPCESYSFRRLLYPSHRSTEWTLGVQDSHSVPFGNQLRAWCPKCSFPSGATSSNFYYVPCERTSELTCPATILPTYIHTDTTSNELWFGDTEKSRKPIESKRPCYRFRWVAGGGVSDFLPGLGEWGYKLHSLVLWFKIWDILYDFRFM